MYRVSAGDTDTALAIDALRIAARCRLRVFAVEHRRTEATTGSVKSHDFAAYLFDPLYTHLDVCAGCLRFESKAGRSTPAPLLTPSAPKKQDVV